MLAHIIAPRLAFVILKYCRPLMKNHLLLRALLIRIPLIIPGLLVIVPIIVPDSSRGPPLQSAEIVRMKIATMITIKGRVFGSLL